MRLGIFGGSFDPVHLGHLLLADCCCTQAKLDVVWFVPTAHQPLKPSGPRAGNAERLRMLQLACASEPKFKICELELERGGVSYTVDTLQVIRDEQPDAELFFLMGADSLADLPSWHRPGDICRLATPLVVHRAKSVEPDFEVLRSLVAAERIDAIRNQLVEMPPTPISSSQIRSLIATEQSWQQFVPNAVADFIEQHQLYVDC